MPNITYTINHAISSELETWLVAQPNLVSFTHQDNGNKVVVVYDHADSAAENTFKRNFARQVNLKDDNPNKYDPDIYTTTNPPPGGSGGDTYTVKATDQLLIGTAYADVTGTGLAVAALTNYEFEFNIIADADAVTTGIDVACNGPAIGTGTINYTQTFWSGATTQQWRPAVAYDSNSANTGSAGTTRAIYTVKGILRNGATAGTLIARIKRENVGTGPNARAGSYGRLKQI